ncbi:hypothetical protein D9M71_572390 [compost metagenome]
MPDAVSGPETSVSMRSLSQDPAVRSTRACGVAVGRLRTKLMVAEGLPVPDIRPLAPRTTSMRSKGALSMLPSRLP